MNWRGSGSKVSRDSEGERERENEKKKKKKNYKFVNSIILFKNAAFFYHGVRLHNLMSWLFAALLSIT
jgi:hypothetical protein